MELILLQKVRNLGDLGERVAEHVVEDERNALFNEVLAEALTNPDPDG